MTFLSVRRFFATALALALAFAVTNSADARPQYNKAFKAVYAEKFEEGKALKCDVCHGKSKKKLSQYGTDLKSKIGGKNVKDGDAIEAALKAAEELKSKTDGKTYGDLLNAGELPAPYSD